MLINTQSYIAVMGNNYSSKENPILDTDNDAVHDQNGMTQKDTRSVEVSENQGIALVEQNDGACMGQKMTTEVAHSNKQSEEEKETSVQENGCGGSVAHKGDVNVQSETKKTDYSSENTHENDPLIGSNDLEIAKKTELVFNIILHCTSENTIKKKKLMITNNFPEKIIHLKKCIQDEFSIPTCCQIMYLESTCLQDTRTLQFYRLRNGDTLHVHYPSEADVEDILDIIVQVIQSFFFVDSIQNKLNNQIVSTELDSSIAQNICNDKIESMATTYFFPCASERAEVNRLLFVHNGGLELLHNLHLQLLRQPWSNSPYPMQQLEHAILRVYWNITATFTIRRLVLNKPSLSAIMKSLLRVEVADKKYLQPIKNVYVDRVASYHEKQRISSEVVYKALGALCNLAELPECRMEIASNKEVLDQFIAIMTASHYEYIASLVAVAGMLCLAYSLDTHVYLATPVMIDLVKEACSMKRQYLYLDMNQRRLNSLLLKYFSCVFYAQLLAGSPHLISLEYKLKLESFMSNFFSEADHKEIRDHEVRNGYKWSTLIPFVKLTYLPRGSILGTSTDVVEHSEIQRLALISLERCCVCCGIFSLQNMLIGEDARDILIKEKLVDYVICMPWCLPKGFEQKKARELVEFLVQKIHIEPPSLINITKAKLASMYFGLEKMLTSMSVHELLTEVYT